MAATLKQYGNATSALGFPCTEKIAKDLDAKLDSGEWEPFKRFSSTLDAFFPGEHADISVVNANSIDKDNEVILPSGFNWDIAFKSNPLVTFGHNYSIPPVGKGVWWKMVGKAENELTFSGNLKWKAKTQYISRPDNHPAEKEWFPESVYHLIKEGALPGKSIGGITKWRDPTAEETQKGIKRIGEETIIYEYSCVPIQSCNDALTLVVSKGLVMLGEETIKSFFPDIWDGVKDIFVEADDTDPDPEPEEDKIPIIKAFTTVSQHKEARKNTLERMLREEMQLKIPAEIEATIKRLTGNVQ